VNQAENDCSLCLYIFSSSEKKIGYPLPRRLARMLITGETVTKDQYVHPSLLKNVSIESLFKLLKFGLWVDYKIRQNTSLSVVDLIKRELDVYQNHDAALTLLYLDTKV
jgi:hypothetical protein